MKKILLSVLLAISCYSFFVSCAINPVTGQRELMFVSESQEIEMGKEIYPNALWGDIGGGGEYKDERLKAYLKDIVLRMHSISHRPHLPVQFVIQNSSIPNAWAIPGYIAITRGLLASLDSEAEFAFIVGHEIGHVSARHSAKQATHGMLQQVGLGAAGMALGGKEYSDIAISVGAVGSSLLLLKYSRDDELEADRLGILYMALLGYNPENAVNAHKNLEKAYQEYIKAAGKNPEEKILFEDLLSTHPRTVVRIEEIQQIIKETRPAAILTENGNNRRRFQEMTADLKNKNKIYLHYYDKAVRAFVRNDIKDAENLAVKAIKEDSSQSPFHALLGFIMLKKENYYEAEKNFRIAMDIDYDYQPAYRGMGTVHYYTKNYHEGIRYLKKGLSLFPNDLLSHYFMGMSYYNIKMFKTAISHLILFEKAQPRHPEIHGILGICYENINDIQSAYNAYLKQLEVAPYNEMGIYAASRAAMLRLIFEGTKLRR